LVLVTVLAAQLAGPDPRIGDDDFQVFYGGAAAIAAGRSPYVGDFVSPPWFALALAPLTLLPLPAARAVWLALNLVLLLVAAALGVELVGLRWPPRRVALAAALYAVWPPVEFGLRLGQNSLLAWVLILGALQAAQKEHDRLSGALLALAAVKPQLVWLFAVGLAMRAAKRSRLATLVASAGTVLAGAALAVAAIAPESYPELLAGQPRTWNYWGSTVTIPPLLATVTGSPVLAVALYLALAAVGTVMVARHWTIDSDVPYLASISACATLLLTPYAYPYDALLLGLPVLWLVARTADRGRLPPLGRALVATVAVLGLVILERPADYDASRFLGLMLPLALLIALVAVQGSARSPTSETRPPAG
jgi:alpha-1,2-mannosyltransferase